MSGEKVEKKKISPSLIIAVIVIIILLAALVYYATLPPKVEVVPTTIVQTALKTETLPGTTIVRTEERTIVQTVTPTPTPKKETVVVWTFPLGAEEEHKKQLKMMEEAFESKNPDIDLVFEVYPWQGRDARMITAAAGGEAPDICYLNTRHIAKLSFLGALQPVENIIPKYYLDNIYPWAIEGAKAGEHIWAATNLISAPYVWWYNPDIFKEVGITPPKGPEDAWSWKQFIEAAKKLKEHGYYVAHPSKPSVVCITRPLFQQAGVDICKQGPPFVTEVMFNNSKGVRAFKFWQDLFYTYGVMHPSMLGAVPEWQPERELFAKKEVAIMLDTTGLPVYLNSIKSDVKAEVLGFLWCDEEGKEHMTGDVVPGYWGIFKQAYNKHPEAVKRVFQWLLSEEGIELWCKWAGFNSPYKTQEGWLKGTELYKIIKGDELAKWLPYGSPEWGNHPAANDIYNIIQANMDAVAHGIMTPEEAVLDAARKCVEAMKRSLSL
jgi:ABC-type glycerol-3-phosphate transport system substrate-binding protein